MSFETPVIVTIVIFIGGLVFAAGRTLERQAAIVRDLAKLEATVNARLDAIERVLYSTVGGRRAIRPIVPADDPAGDSS